MMPISGQEGRGRRGEWLLTLPSLVWLIVFFLVPTLLVMAIAFKPAEINGGIGQGWTLETWRRLLLPTYPAIIWRTIWLSFLCTVICIVMALPVGYWLARLPSRWRTWALMAIILPFWTNFLIRIFAWKSLLHPEGWIKEGLVWLGLIESQANLLYNSGAILLVLVYTYLPFAILPIYAAAEKFDFGLMDAARDLGASRFLAFRRVFLPGIWRGLWTAVLVVLIPAFGSYAIPDLVGGPTSEMIGNKIAQRVFTERNLPHASGLSAVLALIVLLPVLVSLVARMKEERAGASRKEGRS
jgi:spermidine/putrescine transport system permease protein